VETERLLRPLIIGEVLFDCFPDHRVLGGAPFNVAWNLRGLGADPLLVTAVGDDEPGEEVGQAMASWGLDRTALQVDPDHATGRVDISLVEGEPSYRFWDDVAFDHIAPPADDAASANFGLLYHGSLAFRSAVSRSSIAELKRSLRCGVFVDINIRWPHFDPQWVPQLVRDADHVKLNLEELHLLAPPEPADAVGDPWESRRHAAHAVQETYGAGHIWITAGDQGAAWVGPAGEFHHAAAPPVTTMVDTVGAGDAFAAMVIRGILAGAAPEQSLDQAARFAARVCGIRGATVNNPSFYSQDLA
jgi:fructokinase